MCGSAFDTAKVNPQGEQHMAYPFWGGASRWFADDRSSKWQGVHIQIGHPVLLALLYKRTEQPGGLYCPLFKAARQVCTAFSAGTFASWLVMES